MFGRSPTERAQAAESRIRDLLDKAPSRQIVTRPTVEGVLITIGSLPALVVTPGDVDPYTDERLEETAGRLLPAPGSRCSSG